MQIQRHGKRSAFLQKRELRATGATGKERIVLLDGVNHIACITHDATRLGQFYREVFEAEIGETRRHGEHGEETMTVFRIGPHTELNVFTIPTSTEADRQTPMWHRGRLDHFGLQAASPEAFATIRQRLIRHGASDGTVNDFGSTHSMFFRDPDGLEGEVLINKGTTVPLTTR